MWSVSEVSMWSVSAVSMWSVSRSKSSGFQVQLVGLHSQSHQSKWREGIAWALLYESTLHEKHGVSIILPSLAWRHHVSVTLTWNYCVSYIKVIMSIV